LEANRYQKKIFSMLIEKARGERSLRQFSIECDISYVQMRKLVLCVQENPPRPKLIKKIAENCEGGVTFDELMFAAGHAVPERVTRPHSEDDVVRKLKCLSPKSRKLAESYIDYLISEENKKK
jgi:hypothetical protein